MTAASLTRNNIVNAVWENVTYPESAIELAVHEIAAFVLAGNTVRNPQTGEVIEIPARREVKFRPAKDLKTRAAGA